MASSVRTRRLRRGSAQEGIVFIGPTAANIEAFGLKHKARELAKESGVPLLPGSGLLSSLDDAVAAADDIGYPVMLKSTAGGGGIGMSLCADEPALRAAFETVQRTARSSFGDARVYLERFVSDARHVEVQIFGDGKGRGGGARRARLFVAAAQPEGAGGNAGARASASACATGCTRRRSISARPRAIAPSARWSSSTTRCARSSISSRSTRACRSSIR